MQVTPLRIPVLLHFQVVGEYMEKLCSAGWWLFTSQEEEGMLLL